jgi:hypothetical protein
MTCMSHVVLGCSHVLKKPNNRPRRRPRRYANALQLLDYRCHVPGGEIGTAYPPHVSVQQAAVVVSAGAVVAVQGGGVIRTPHM